MSTDGTDDDNSDGENHECPVDWCDYTSPSKRGLSCHKTNFHERGPSKEDVLDDIRAVSEKLTKPPSKAEYNEHSEFSTTSAINRFGSWTNAVSEAGLEPNDKPEKIAREDLVMALSKLGDELGGAPRMSDMDERGQYSTGAYQREFEDWATALREAGFTPNRRHNYTREELLDILTGIAEDLGKTPTRADIRGTDYSISWFEDKFGSWNNAIREAGFEVNHRNDVPTGELVDEIKRLHSELGRVPTSVDMRDLGKHDPVTYQRTFGTWNDGLREAGFEASLRRNIPTDELLEDLNRIECEVGRTPMRKDLDTVGEFSAIVYRNRFGSWNNALIRAGYEPNLPRGLDKKTLLEEIHRIVNETGEVPTYSEMNAMGSYCLSNYYRLFGTFNNALEEADYETFWERYEPTESEQLNYGRTWPEKSQARRDHDGNKCLACSITNNEHLEIYGLSLPVHHVVGVREFIEDGELDEERAHRLENLRTFCCECHAEWEDVPVAPMPVENTSD